MPGNFHAVPESVIESWPTPNYVDPVRRSWLPAFACVFLGVSTILVTGRFYLRANNKAGAFGLDDLLIAVAWLFSVGLSTVACIDSEWYGLDVHTWDVRIEWYSGAALMGWIAQVFMLTSTCATKCSVLLFYRRMVKDTGRWIYATYAALAFTCSYFLGILIAYCLICRPLDAYWLSYDFTYNKSFKCVDGNALSLCVGILSVVSDLYAVILPYVILRHYDLNIPRRQRIGLNIIFSLSIMVAGAGVARTYYLWRINHTYDTSWTGFDLFVWSLVECHLAIICACAPHLRAFIRHYLSDPFNRTFRSSSYARSKQATKTSRQSTAQKTWEMAPAHGNRVSVSDERGLTKPSDEYGDGSAVGYEKPLRARSSDTMPTLKTAEDYEAYAMAQLNRHAYKRSDTMGSAGYDFADPKRKHDMHDAV